MLGIFIFFVTLYRRYRLDTKRGTIETYRYGTEKPERMAGRPLELFYKSRPLWVALQIMAVVAIAAWTVQNYIHMLKSL